MDLVILNVLNVIEAGCLPIIAVKIDLETERADCFITVMSGVTSPGTKAD
jgi:hypothetical protein